ncbi:unnamed protein product [Rotaria magnacalcarata]|uniref:Insulin-like domain-containing protein n=3 Tax=Rotaria magnacalcarata TaxID=392030 RepID=A0A816QDQ0_9BILA|nr:unnamed protein product [Rotaria magnacalcarata]CAF2059163.1 unnamed protein product [Rotaria magnacalcarata]
MCMMSFTSLLLILIVVISKTDGKQNTLKSLTNSCTLQHGTSILKEDSKVVVDGKVFKVENCELQRAYQTCGPNLWNVINIVCDAIRRETIKGKTVHRLRRSSKPKLITEACCENYCTVLEMAHFCPS